MVPVRASASRVHTSGMHSRKSIDFADADLSEADQERCRAYPVYALDLDQFPITEGLSLFAFETPLLPESISSMAK